MKLRVVVAEAWRSLTASLSTTLAAALTVLIGMFLVGLADKVKNFPDQLSGGEQQRLSVARAFVNHPPLLLADEPTGNLDPNTSIGIMQVLYRINRTGTTVVVVTHDSEMVDKMRRRVIALDQGRVVRDQAAGTYSADDESTREFAARLRDEMGVDDERPSY